MENTEKFRTRKYSKQTATNIYAAPTRGVNKTWSCTAQGNPVGYPWLPAHL